jgi:hypothetical protein
MGARAGSPLPLLLARHPRHRLPGNSESPTFLFIGMTKWRTTQIGPASGTVIGMPENLARNPCFKTMA